MYYQHSIYDKFVEKSVSLAKTRKVGNPFDPDTLQGPLISEEHVKKVTNYIRQASKDGARLLCGGNRIGTKGYYLEPAVFSHVEDHFPVFQDEVFGPVMTINRFNRNQGMEGILKRANDTPYGLAAAIFTNNIPLGNEFCRRVRAGMVFWNCYHVVDTATPFGGLKYSGFGREGGSYGLTPYMEVKYIAQRIVA